LLVTHILLATFGCSEDTLPSKRLSTFRALEFISFCGVATIAPRRSLPNAFEFAKRGDRDLPSARPKLKLSQLQLTRRHRGTYVIC
jgi:hypothetical protein